MKLNENQIVTYINDPDLYVFIRVILNNEKNKEFANSNELIDYSLRHKNEISEIIDDIFAFINTPIYFTVDELKELQSSDHPFTDEKIEDIMDSELEKENYMDINCDVVDFCLDWLDKKQYT